MKNPLLVSMFANCTRPVAAALLLMLQLPVAAVHAGQLSEWYLQRLFEPTDRQLAMEAQSRVQIYSGMKDTDVLRALDEQFQRIDSMMFTGTIVTDPDGAAVKDPETGEALVENDGC